MQVLYLFGESFHLRIESTHFASPLFLVWSQERERAWYEERGAYTGIGNVKNWRETVTVYFKAKATSNFHDRMDWDAVRRANGILVTI